jgi:hypothetical protein
MRQIDMSNRKTRAQDVQLCKQKLEFAADSEMTRVELETDALLVARTVLEIDEVILNRLAIDEYVVYP